MKIHELNLDYINRFNEDEFDEKYSFDNLFENNTDLINDIDDMYYDNKLPYVYFKYKNIFFKVSCVTCEEHNNLNRRCPCNLNNDCKEIFPFCLTEMLYREEEGIKINEIDEYEIVFGKDNDEDI